MKICGSFEIPPNKSPVVCQRRLNFNGDALLPTTPAAKVKHLPIVICVTKCHLNVHIKVVWEASFP